MRRRFVLVHSPSVGPATWQPVADVLSVSHPVTVADLRGVADAGPAYGAFVAGRVAAAVRADAAAEPLVVVTHSNAGYFAPLVAAELERSAYDVAALVFVDAGIPAESGVTDLGGAFLPRLRELAVDGVLPRWTDWWPPEVAAELVPDPELCARVVAEQPRLPLSYYEEPVETGTSWGSTPCGYVWFNEGYDGELAQAESLGWPVRRVPGEHLHMVVDPVAVAAAVVDVADAAAG